MNDNQAIDAFGALAHETRLKIIRHLITRGEGGDPAGVIGEIVQAAPSKITFHISALERAGLVSSKRVSRTIVYSINYEQMGKLINYLLEDCCQNDPGILSCCSPTKRRNRN